MYRPLGMVCRIFHPIDCSGLNRLVGVGQFFHGFVVRFGLSCKPLWIARLTCAIGPDLPWIIAEIIELCLFVAPQLGRAFVFFPSALLCHAHVPS